MTRKSEFVEDMQQDMNLLGRLVDHARSLVKQWFAEGYNSGGADELVIGDLSGTSLLVADVTAGITLLQQLVALNDNTALTQADYATTIAKLRTNLG